MFTEIKVREVVKNLLELEVKEPQKDIILFIDSHGGFIDSFFAIHDAINLISSDVATVCLGSALSCGALLLMSGKKGKRFITENSRVLIHEISSGSIGKLSDMDIDLKESQRLQKKIEKMIFEYTKIKEDTYTKPM
jgi:ATP-dependent Clp protease protease subunit